MITDKLATLADAVALNTGAAGNYTIGDVIDLGAAKQLNDPKSLYLVITVDVTATSGGSATLAVALLTDDNAAMSSPTVVWQGNAVAVATLVAGYRYAVVELPKGADNYERYLGLRQVTGTAAFTAGAINAFLTHDVPATLWRAYSDGISSAA